MNHYTKYLCTLVVILLSSLSLSAFAQIQVQDDSGEVITLKQPARKVISLSPGLTELIYAAGGAEYIKGAVNFSDYPDAAKKLPQIGGYNALDMEKILILQPDLIVAWKVGNPQHQIKQLKKLGLTVYISEPGDFMDIPRTIIQLGKLMATEAIARQSAKDFTEKFEQLKRTHKTPNNEKKQRTFIQIWNNPVMTVNQHHLISKVVTMCGGQNIFAQTKGLSNSPTIEAILQQDPEIIIATGMAESASKWLQRWQQWPFLKAVKNNRLYAANPNHLVRHTPRILLGIKEVCEQIKSMPSP